MKTLTAIGWLFYSCLFTLFIPVDSQASLQATPTRVVLTQKRRAGRISLRNRSNKTKTYRIRLAYFRMLPSGKVVEVKETTPADRSIIPHIKFSPRRVTLPPNLEQVVRVMAYKTQNLEKAAYRCHIHFSEVEQVTAPNIPGLSPAGISMNLSAKVAIAVPIIYEHQNPTVEVTLSSLKFGRGKDGKTYFSVDIHKKGTGFAYGDFKIILLSSQEETILASVKGVAAYIDYRKASYPLELPTNLYADAKLRLEYRQPIEQGGELMAYTEIPFAPKKRKSEWEEIEIGEELAEFPSDRIVDAEGDVSSQLDKGASEIEALGILKPEYLQQMRSQLESDPGIDIEVGQYSGKASGGLRKIVNEELSPHT